MFHRFTLASLFLVALTGLSAPSAGRPAPFADPPKAEQSKVSADTPKINIPATRFTGSDSGTTSKPVPTTLAKSQKYVIDAAMPLVVDQFSADSGRVKITERKGPRPYSVHNTVTVHSAEADNEDVVIIPGPFLYEIQHESDGVVFLEAFPALGKPSSDGKPIPLTRDDIVRRVLTLGQGPRPPPDDPDADVAALVAQLRTAYANESANDKAQSIKELASLYRTMAKSLAANDATVAKLTTQVQFGEAMKAARAGLIGEKIEGVRDVVGDFFNKRWAVAPDAKFDATAKSKAAATLNQAAKALEYLR